MALSNQARRALVTGASGFLGTRLCQDLRSSGWQLITMSRRADSNVAVGGNEDVEQSIQFDLAELGNDPAPTLVQQTLADIDTVFHLAGLAHQAEKFPDANRYMLINGQATGQLAALAARSGVRRFVLVSSIKAMSGSSSDEILTPEHRANPDDAYGRSKLAGEQALIAQCRESPMQAVIFRPPLVYGAGARANLALLMQAVQSNWPLPLKAVRNRRAMIGRTTLSRLLIEAAESASAAGRVYLPADWQPSTPELIDQIGSLMNRQSRLFSLPAPVLAMACRLPGLGPRLSRLTQSLALDDPQLLADSAVIHQATPNRDLTEMVQAWRPESTNG